MDEWWTYSLSDFLLFSPRTYYRMLERHNESVWPGQILTLGIGLGILGLLPRSTPWRGRIISAALAGLWGWVAWWFLYERYASINWAATYFAWFFLAEALLFVLIGVIQGKLRYRAGRDARAILGIAVFVAAVALYPMIAPLAGRSLSQAEIVGVVPDPTVLATLGLLLLTEGRPRWGLLVVPILWCAFTGATLWVMGSPEALVPPLAALLAIAATSGARGTSARTA
jgi:hypothetical protein